MPLKSIKFERQSLYEEVWTTPVSKLAAAHGVSSYDITKAARSMGIPLPPNGHWTKVAHGKGVPRPPLPPGKFPTTYQNSVNVRLGDEDTLERFNKALEAKPVAALVLPPMAKTLNDCLPIVKRTAAHIVKAPRDNRGWRRACGMGCFEVAVSPDLEVRALLTLDRVLRLCEQAGLTYAKPNHERGAASFSIEGILLTVRIFESAKQAERALTPKEQEQRERDPNGYVYIPDRYSYTSSGKLRLEGRQLDRSWPEFSVVDGTSKPLHERIGEVPEKLIQAALFRKAQTEHWEEQSRRAEAHRRMLAEKAEVRRLALAKLESFEKLALDADRATSLRNLSALLEANRESSPYATPENLAWIRNAADWLDPLVKRHWPEVDDAS